MAFKPYKSYRFLDKDPIIDRMRTMVQDSGASHMDIHNESGVSVGCLNGWFYGATRRPQYATIAAVAHVLGYEFAVVKKQGGKVVKFEPRRKRA